MDIQQSLVRDFPCSTECRGDEELATGRLIDGSSCDGIDMVIKDLDLEPKSFAVLPGGKNQAKNRVVRSSHVVMDPAGRWNRLGRHPDLTNYADQDDSQIPALENIYDNPNDGIFTNASYDDEGAVADFTNLETTVNRRNNHKSFQHCLFACFLSQIEPKKISEAIEDESWVDVMQEELLQFKIQKVWILVDFPYRKKVIRTKWVYKNKKDERGVMVRNKVRIEAIRIFLAFASYMGFIVYQMDVKSAFLYGTIDEEVYVSQPPGFVDPMFPKKVYKVMKALYGLPKLLEPDMIEESVEIFMDDFSVFGNSFDTCLNNLDKMLQRCKDAHLVLNWEKCHFMVKEGIVLGHKVSSAGLEVDKAKIDVILKLPPPTNIKSIRSFLGHASFYRRFIKDFSKIARPLTKLLEKDTPFEFDDECRRAFESLKEKLTCAPVIVSPNWNLPFELMCDASDFAIGAVLAQKDADHLSRIENNETSDDSEFDDNFPGETLIEININEPWFADFANYLVGGTLSLQSMLRRYDQTLYLDQKPKSF
ncbi:reverse transcriptase domain-containing protein [Tanacetum coccineum]